MSVNLRCLLSKSVFQQSFRIRLFLGGMLRLSFSGSLKLKLRMLVILWCSPSVSFLANQSNQLVKIRIFSFSLHWTWKSLLLFQPWTILTKLISGISDCFRHIYFKSFCQVLNIDSRCLWLECQYQSCEFLRNYASNFIHFWYFIDSGARRA